MQPMVANIDEDELYFADDDNGDLSIRRNLPAARQLLLASSSARRSAMPLDQRPTGKALGNCWTNAI